jgi:hypothetical protein
MGPRLKHREFSLSFLASHSLGHLFLPALPPPLFILFCSSNTYLGKQQQPVYTAQQQTLSQHCPLPIHSCVYCVSRQRNKYLYFYLNVYLFKDILNKYTIKFQWRITGKYSCQYALKFILFQTFILLFTEIRLQKFVTGGLCQIFTTMPFASLYVEQCDLMCNNDKLSLKKWYYNVWTQKNM